MTLILFNIYFCDFMYICIGWEHEYYDTHEENRGHLWSYHEDPSNCAQVLGLGDKSIWQASLDFEC